MKTKHKKAAPERGGKTKTMFAVVSASPESLSSPADEINRLHDELNELARTALQTAMHIGELLTEQKAKCGHGKWLKWLKENVRFSQPTAWNYMRLHAERAKLSTVDNLTDAYRLLAGESRDQDDPEEVEASKTYLAGRKPNELNSSMAGSRESDWRETEDPLPVVDVESVEVCEPEPERIEEIMKRTDRVEIAAKEIHDMLGEQMTRRLFLYLGPLSAQEFYKLKRVIPICLPKKRKP